MFCRLSVTLLTLFNVSPSFKAYISVTPAICRLLLPLSLLFTAPVSPYEPPHRHLQPPRRL